MLELPTGTVTFLYTDLEGSTRLWERAPAATKAAVARHDALLRPVVVAHHGHVFRTVGDGLCAAFATAPDAVAAALGGQRGLYAEAWGEPGPLRVRMALHTGAVDVQGGDYSGACLNRVARLLALAHGGQTLLSLATVQLVRDALPRDAALHDLGEHRLRDLVQPERVYQLLHPDLPMEFPPLRSLDAYPHNLPLQLTSFVGRERELAAVRRLLDETRLLTLTGAGGCGKTRLALHVAADLVDDYPDGVFLVSLAPVTEPELVTAAIAHALGMYERGDQPLAARIADGLRAKRMLLVLDNFEHLATAAPLVSDLLAACPDLKVLATSRTPLHLTGEQEYPVPPLTVPDLGQVISAEAVARFAALTLFVQRARAVKPDFAVDDALAPALAAICRHLDGLPLAIELAAARVKLLTPQEILARLGETASGSPTALRLLAGGPRDAPARQRTLRDTIAWSHALLVADEQRLFRRLAVFVGGCTLEAAEVVAGAEKGTADSQLDVLDGITSLVDKSLLHHLEQVSGATRVGMMETIREYGLERLAADGEADHIGWRHTAYYLALAERAEPGLTSAEQGRWLERLEAEHDNLRAALRWALEREDRATALQLSGALWRFWHMRGALGEGRRWLERALVGADAVAAAIRAKALNGAGVLAYYQGDLGRAAALCGESLALCRAGRDGSGVADALLGLALVARSGDNLAAARAMYAESLTLVREVGDPWRVAYALTYAGMVLFSQGDLDSLNPGTCCG